METQRGLCLDAAPFRPAAGAPSAVSGAASSRQGSHVAFPESDSTGAQVAWPMQAPPRPGRWVQLLDGASGHAYYFNESTRETTWLAPSSFVQFGMPVVLHQHANVQQQQPQNEQQQDEQQQQQPAHEQQVQGVEAAGEAGELHKAADEGDDRYAYGELGGVAAQRCWGRPMSRELQGRISRESRFKSLASIDPESLTALAQFADKCRHGHGCGAVAEPVGAEQQRRKRADTSSSLMGLAEAEAGTGTIANPDATEELHCVSAVMHAHMVQFVLAGYMPSHERYSVFNEEEVSQESQEQEQGGGALRRGRRRRSSMARRMPTREEIFEFLQNVHVKAQLEKECIIMSFAYMERLLKATRGQLALNEANWKGIALSAMILASKVWDDLSMWNADFSKICPKFPLKRINQLEVCLLEAVKYDVRISNSQYAEYYFRLRSMRKALGVRVIVANNKPSKLFKHRPRANTQL